MCNALVGWFGDLFRTFSGLVLFDGMALAAAAALAWCQRRGALRDGWLWGALAGVGVLYALARIAGLAGLARGIGLVGLAAWIPALLSSARKKPYGAWGWGNMLAVAATATALFAIGGPLPPDQTLSIELILGWLHWPLAFVMGVPAPDCLTVGRFLGEKLILTEFTAYLDLSFYLGAVARGEAMALDPRSLVILSYALCGFANVASVGILMGGLTPLAPSRRHEIARLGAKALVGGALATFMTACVAGAFYSGRSMLGL
jgi:hypothetical protein